MICVINGQDFTANVISSTYKINQEDSYSTWTDANFREHRSNYHSQVKGTFDVYFKTMDAYKAFVDRTYSTRTKDGTCHVKLTVNNTAATFEGRAFVDFKPARSRTGDLLEDYIEKFTVTIGEC